MTEEFIPNILGLCGRAGAGKTTVEKIISAPVRYKTKEVKNRLDYILTVLENKVNKQQLKELLCTMIDPKLHELDTNGKYTVWTRNKNLLNMSLYNSLSFAEPLKIIASVVFNYDFNILLGLTTEQRKQRETLKTQNYTTCGALTGRECLEYLGTNVLRNHLSSTIWVDITMTRAQKLIDKKYSVCISDVRFQNEYQAIKSFTYQDQEIGEIWVIFREYQDFQITDQDHQNHISSYAFLEFIDIDNDVLIHNDTSLDKLKSNIYEILDWIE